MPITGVCGEQRDHSSVVGAASAHHPVHFKCCKSLVALAGAIYLRSMGLCFSGAFKVALWVSPFSYSWVQNLCSLQRQCRMALVLHTVLLAVRRQSGYGRPLRLKSLGQGPTKGLVFL